MTSAEFEQAADDVYDGWWMTGEALIHVSTVMSVEGWNLYGHPGFRALTPAQRTLMLWSDIVGQVSNGGFVQFCQNFARELRAGVEAVEALGWLELRARFGKAMVEQAGSTDAPVLREPLPLSADPEKWKASRQRLLRHLARQGRPWWKPTTGADLAQIEARYEEWRLELKYQEAVFSGELKSGGERLFDFVPPPNDQADEFDTWFYADETRAASKVFVKKFIMDNQEQLYRSG